MLYESGWSILPSQYLEFSDSERAFLLACIDKHNKDLAEQRAEAEKEAKRKANKSRGRRKPRV